MPHSVLDAPEEKKVDLLARRSFTQFLISLSTYLVPIVIVLAGGLSGKNSDFFATIIGLAVIVGYGFCIIGLINGIRSVWKKETDGYKKYIGLVGNLVLVLLMIAMFFVNLIDVNNALNN